MGGGNTNNFLFHQSAAHGAAVLRPHRVRAAALLMSSQKGSQESSLCAHPSENSFFLQNFISCVSVLASP